MGWALLIGGVLFLAVEFHLRGKKLGEEVTWTIAVAVGLGQLVAAMFPGASRSGTTIMISLLLGLSRTAATEFSFLVSIPTMLAAGGYEVFEALRHPVAGTPPENWDVVMLGTIISAVVSFIAVKWLLHYIQSHRFTVFAWYRIALGAALLLVGFQQRVEVYRHILQLRAAAVFFGVLAQIFEVNHGLPCNIMCAKTGA